MLVPAPVDRMVPSVQNGRTSSRRKRTQVLTFQGRPGETYTFSPPSGAAAGNVSNLGLQSESR